MSNRRVQKPAAKPRAPKADRRVPLAFIGLSVALACIVGRAWVLQVDRADTLRKMAEEQYLKEVEVPARRGAIYDRAGNAIAVSNAVESVFVRPRAVDDPKRVSQELSKRLSLPLAEVSKKVSGERMFTWVKKRIDPGIGADLRALNLAGVGTVPDTRRYYPNRTLFSHLLGAVDIDGKGIEGLEAVWEKELGGEPVIAAALRDARGRTMLFDDVSSAPGLTGNDIQLTVDRDLQTLAAQALAEGVQHVHARAGSAIVMDPATGDILALANYPEFNPNTFDKAPAEAKRNRAVVDLFEPGSTFKAITVAAALEEGLVRTTDQIFCEQGKWKVGGETIHDTHPMGLVSVKRIIASSSNIGSAKMAIQLGRERLHKYVQAFGFGRKSGLELPGEAAGLLRPAKKWPLIQLATIAFGQGIAVSGLQVAQAYATFANRGVQVAPRLVSAVIEPDGQRRTLPRPAAQRVVSTATADAVNEMLEGVVTDDHGTGHSAQIAGVRVAGKTATAQKVDPVLRGYAPDKYVANFAGFVPADAPKYVIVVVVDEPQKGMHFGAQAAAPIFQKIAVGALQQAGLLPGNATVTDLVVAENDDTGAEAEESTVVPGVLPDFRGLMLREAFELMRKAEVSLEPEVKGSGRIVAQEPAPGSKWHSGGKLKLTLASARTALSSTAVEQHAAR